MTRTRLLVNTRGKQGSGGITRESEHGVRKERRRVVTERSVSLNGRNINILERPHTPRVGPSPEPTVNRLSGISGVGLARGNEKPD